MAYTHYLSVICCDLKEYFDIRAAIPAAIIKIIRNHCDERSGTN